MRPRKKTTHTPTGVEYERCEWKEREVLSAHQPLSFAQPTPSHHGTGRHRHIGARRGNNQATLVRRAKRTPAVLPGGSYQGTFRSRTLFFLVHIMRDQIGWGGGREGKDGRLSQKATKSCRSRRTACNNTCSKTKSTLQVRYEAAKEKREGKAE